MGRLTPTSYAILGLLSIRPWSTYELTRQMRRSVGHVWPRAESNLYREPERLVEAGLAAAEVQMVGRRRRTQYSITTAGRDALADWMHEPAGPTEIESETLLKVLFGDAVPREVLEGHLERFAAEAEAGGATWRQIAGEYLAGDGPFPERIHVNVLYWVLLDRWARLRADWARWAIAEVEAWPDERGPQDRNESLRLLRRALDGEPGLLAERRARPED